MIKNYIPTYLYRHIVLFLFIYRLYDVKVVADPVKCKFFINYHNHNDNITLVINNRTQ